MKTATQARTKDEVPGAVVSSTRHPLYRERTVLVTSVHGEPCYKFDADGRAPKGLLHAYKLCPILLVTHNSIVEAEVYRDDPRQPFDTGQFEVSLDTGLIIARGFKKCFERIIGEPVANITAWHLQQLDRMRLMNIHNGLFKRARDLASKGHSTIQSILPVPEFQLFTTTFKTPLN